MVTLHLISNILPMPTFENEETNQVLPPLVVDTEATMPSVEHIALPAAQEENDTGNVSTAPPVQEPLDEEVVSGKPFVIELLRLDVEQSGKFRPDSAVQITKNLRTSGLLHALPPDELKTLLWMLTFTTPNGDCLPSLPELTQAMQVSELQARQRMERLLRFRWQGQALIIAVSSETGLERYALAPPIVSFVERPPTTAYSPTALEPRTAGRDAIIAYSRARYARPRAEVEAMIARQMGWEQIEPPDDPQEREVWEARQTLRAMGVTKEQADNLFAKYPFERIQRQMIMLPYRNAKNPLGFLLAAIEGDYETPLSLKAQITPLALPPSEPNSSNT